ncbi:hypothetical protein [Nocardia sp. CNY236]|uniref:hypothetical protein n=1 Tax=Nocardia sp. CNY236 TaxID=1169152 RepID=UPI0004128C34|nr:hypothetical protein [Nocardia sp. CNY236]
MTIWVVSSNLPLDDAPFRTHVRGEDDALELLRAMAELMLRDGERSAEEQVDIEESAGDAAMVELLREGSELFRDLLFSVTQAISVRQEFRYVIHWSDGTIHYCAAPSPQPAAVCSDEKCGDCHGEVEHASALRD